MAAFPPPRLTELATRAVALLRARKETVALVETATGGLVASTILSLPGTSAVFAGSVIAYQLKVRERWLGWRKEQTARYDGPSEAICLSLASSCRAELGATYALAESGVAGPGRPDVYRAEIDGPGYCPLALVSEASSVGKTVRVPQGDDAAKSRAENMVAFAEATLELLLDELEKREKEDGR